MRGLVPLLVLLKFAEFSPCVMDSTLAGKERYDD
jgi:hypothetical protein